MNLAFDVSDCDTCQRHDKIHHKTRPRKTTSCRRISDVIREIQTCGFRADGRHETMLSHDNELVRGCVWNFRKNGRCQENETVITSR